MIFASYSVNLLVVWISATSQILTISIKIDEFTKAALF